MIDIEQYPLVKLPDVSKILSSIVFFREYRNSAAHGKKLDYIHSPEIYDPMKMEFKIDDTETLLKGFAILPDTQKVDIFYLTSILNAYISWAFITDGKVDKKTSVTIKKLSNVSVRLLSAQLQEVVDYLYYLLIDVKNQKKDKSDNLYRDYWISVYKEALNAIAFELIMPQIFREYDIYMLDSWSNLLRKCFEENPEINLEQLKDFLGKELLTPQNLVVGNMKKLRVVMQTITEQVPNHV